MTISPLFLSLRGTSGPKDTRSLPAIVSDMLCSIRFARFASRSCGPLVFDDPGANADDAKKCISQQAAGVWKRRGNAMPTPNERIAPRHTTIVLDDRDPTDTQRISDEHQQAHRMRERDHRTSSRWPENCPEKQPHDGERIVIPSMARPHLGIAKPASRAAFPPLSEPQYSRIVPGDDSIQSHNAPSRSAKTH